MQDNMDSETGAFNSTPGDDLSPLAWVHGELRRSLETAHKSLRRYLKDAESAAGGDLDAVDPSVLRSARTQLHQGVGALELVGLPAVADVLRASEAAVQRMVSKPALVDAAAVDVVEKVSFALLDYLTRLLARKPVSPVMLFPQYRAAQQLAGADRVHPADLWKLDWQWLDLPPDPRAAPQLADDEARGRMETQVLGLMRKPGRAALARMSDLCADLAAGARGRSGSGLVTLWQLAAAVFEAQAQGLLDTDVYSKRLASRLLAQLRSTVRGQPEASVRLAQDLLFFCSHAREPASAEQAPRLTAVRRVWRLQDQPVPDYETPRLGRFDPAQLQLARKRVATAKDAWSAVAGGEQHRISGLPEQFALVGESLQRLFPGGEVLAQVLQATVAQSVSTGQAPRAPLAMEVATGILYLDASLEDGELDQPELPIRIQHLAGRIDSVRQGADPQPLDIWMEELYRRVSDRQTMGSVVQELRASLSEVEKQIDQYFRNPAERQVLIPVPAQLSSMRGVLSVLGMDQASQAALFMRDDVDALAQTEVDPQRAIQAGTFDRLADNLGALSFLIDMLSVQPQLAKSLFRFNPETGVLSAVMGQSERVSAFAQLDDTEPASLGPAIGTAAAAPLLQQVQALGAAAAQPQVSDQALARDAERLAQQALAADQPELARLLSSAHLGLRGGVDVQARQALRMELAAAAAGLGAVAAADVLPPPAPVPPPKPTPQGGTGLEDDEEMRDIFIEEAREVVADATDAVERLLSMPDSTQDMTAVRRAFHTLKGSSRMVGLKDFGEAAWSCEQLFNARLAQAPHMDPALRLCTSEALVYLGGWVEAIAAGRAEGHHATPVTRAADALRLEGTRLAIVPPAPATAAIAGDRTAKMDGGERPAADGEATVAWQQPAAGERTVAWRPAAQDERTVILPRAIPATDLEAVPATPEQTLPQPSPAASEPAAADAAPTGLELESVWPEPAVPAQGGLLSQAPEFAASEPAAPVDDQAWATAPMQLAEPAGQAVRAVEAEPEPEFELSLPDLDETPSTRIVPGVQALLERVPELPHAGDLDLTPRPPLSLEIQPNADADAGLSTFELDLGDFNESAVAPLAPSENAADPVAVPVLELEPATVGVEEQLPDTVEALEIDVADFGDVFNEGSAQSGAVPEAAAQALAQSPEPGRLLELPGEAAGAVEAAGTPDSVDGSDEQVKVIGPLRIGIPLFNIYLNEADELSRRLVAELGEWALEADRQPVSDTAVALAHSLAGSSATVGYAELSALARSLEHALMRSRSFGHGRPGEPELFGAAAEEIRRLLHQFAAGFLRPVEPALTDRLAAHERLPVESADALMDLDATVEAEAPSYVPSHLAVVPSDHAAEEDDLDAQDAIDSELFPIFEEEAEELLPQLQARLRDWHDHPGNPAAPSACMRTLHTFKGGARLAGAMRLGEMAHRLESAVEHLMAQDAPQAHEVEPLLLRADAMVSAFESLRQQRSTPAEAAVLPIEPASAAAESEAVPVEPLVEPATSEPAPAIAEPIGPADDAPDLDVAGLLQAAPAPTIGDEPLSAVPAALPLGVDVPDVTQVEAANDGRTARAPALVAAPLPIDWGRFGVDGAGTPAGMAQSADRSGPVAGAAVRVRAGLLDRLVNNAGEVSITRARIDGTVQQMQGSLGELTESLERMRRQLRDIELQAETQISTRLEAAKAASQTFDPLEMDRFTRFQELTRFMAESVNDVATLQRSLQRTLQSAEDELAAQARLTRELQDDLLRTRMVEFESLADRLYRTVRQAARDTSKQVRLDIVGGGIEIDRGVLERMVGSFEHLLRNSVAHGVESPAERTRAGKEPAGLITVTLAQSGNEVAVEFADDGAGLDLARIRSRAVERGLLALEAQASDAELAQLIFAPGFSTADSVTELAGRGVGLDVVRSEVNAMGGRIETATEAGRGTRFRLLLPLTTAVTQVVMLRCGETRVAVPSPLIEVVRRVPTAEVQKAYTDGHLLFGGEQVPFFWLAGLLQAGTRGPDTGRTQSVVVIRSASQRVAVHVDEVLGNQEVVVKNVGPQLSRLPGLAGVTLLPSGAVALIYNPVALASLYAQEARALAQPAVASEMVRQELPAAVRDPMVLVVDDSLTVRRVTQRLLVREGYRVVTAKDGLDALERLAEERPAVLLSDIEMPRMDGFDLVRNVRADPRLRGLPVVMITSRIAQKHRDYAVELGVDHYLGKPYSEEELLSLVAGYVGAKTTG
jgi:chemosensory pili system protein ChpA (sensor histidine kinase/response regulator)